MDFSIASFFSGFLTTFLIIFIFKDVFFTFFKNSEVNNLIKKIKILEDRIEKKNELIAKAIRAEGSKA